LELDQRMTAVCLRSEKGEKGEKGDGGIII
jgi:hypothetical protein